MSSVSWLLPAVSGQHPRDSCKSSGFEVNVLATIRVRAFGALNCLEVLAIPSIDEVQEEKRLLPLPTWRALTCVPVSLYRCTYPLIGSQHRVDAENKIDCKSTTRDAANPRRSKLCGSRWLSRGPLITQVCPRVKVWLKLLARSI